MDHSQLRGDGGRTSSRKAGRRRVGSSSTHSASLDHDVGVIQVGAAELKSRLGKYLGMVREGATIDVTSYRRSVAKLVPAVEEKLLIEEPTEPPDALAQLDRLPSGRSIPGMAALLADRRRR